MTLPDRLAVVARHREDVGWLARSPIAHAIVDKAWIPNVGGDASSYLAWIVLNYHALPKWCLFLHAHEYHWHHARYSQLRSMRIDLEAAGRGFLSVNHIADGSMILFSKDLLAELSDDEHTSLRRELLGLSTRYTGRVRHAPCGQFWVRRDRILARPRAFYQRLFDALTDAHHPLLSRQAVAEGYPSRMLHVFFIEGYWHYVFGEDEDYAMPYWQYDQMPLVRFASLPDEGIRPVARQEFPPLRLTRAGLDVHLHKQPHLRPQRRGNTTTAAHSSGDAAFETKSARLLLSKVAHGCDCAARRNQKPPETCKRAADAAIRLLIKVGDEQRLAASADYCDALSELITPLPADARERVRLLSSMCFGGVGGARDYALAAIVSCLNAREAQGKASPSG